MRTASAIGTYWTFAKGYRLRPWASPFIRWRLETLLGGDMHALGAKQFFAIVWRERQRLTRFLDWAEEHRH
jgi:hypothetical protein